MNRVEELAYDDVAHPAPSEAEPTEGSWLVSAFNVWKYLIGALSTNAYGR